MKNIWILIFFIIGGCSSSVYVNELTDTYKKFQNGEIIKGVPFRLMQPTEVYVYKYNKKDDIYEKIHNQNQNLPDQSKLYSINFKANYFSNSNVGLEINPNNSISSVSVKEEGSTFDEFVAQLALTTTATTNAVLEIEEKRKKAEKDKESEKKEERKATQSALEAAQQAIVEVEKANQALANASNEEKIIKMEELRLAQIKANHAFINAGLAPPF